MIISILVANTKPIQWQGPDQVCDFCKMSGIDPPLAATVDGKTLAGPWGLMCEKHFRRHGVGLGVGRGQRLTEAKPKMV